MAKSQTTEYQDQPMPTPGQKAVRPEVERLFAAILAAQCSKGIARYGTPLQTHNGRDALMDALAELVDGFQYIVQATMERDVLAIEVERLRGILAEKDAEIKRLARIDSLWASAVEGYFLCTVKNIKARDDINTTQATELVALRAKLAQLPEALP